MLYLYSSARGPIDYRYFELMMGVHVPCTLWCVRQQGTNAIHGIQNTECIGDACPTSFPAPCGLAATFNMSTVREMGAVIGQELRAYWNEQKHNSLDTWSPTININRFVNSLFARCFVVV